MQEKIDFQRVESEYIKRTFLKVYRRYASLHSRKIIVRRRALRHTTMQAQPVVDRSFFRRSRRRFRIDVSDHTVVNERIKVPELPEKVLMGWFAHELGHVMDYLKRGAFNLMRFGVGYVSSESFRIGAERIADLYAIEHGFGEEILATKKFILHEAGLPERYLARIDRYYMSPEELEWILKGEVDERVAMDQPELRPWQLD